MSFNTCFISLAIRLVNPIPMKIGHIAIWVHDLEMMRSFYMQHFNLKSNDMYFNPNKQFSSYFLSFESGARIELMHRPDISKVLQKTGMESGFTHFAVSLRSRELVDSLTETIRVAGHKVVSDPRTTGDGYYESVITNPEGNWIELTV
jgi:lactoylglutathione lyase